eukprot:11216636-Alexandrium_andersonii.AAC.1
MGLTPGALVLMCGLGCAFVGTRWAARWAGIDVDPACCSPVRAAMSVSAWTLRVAVRSARSEDAAVAGSRPRSL